MYKGEMGKAYFWQFWKNAVLYAGDILVLIVYGTALGANSTKLGEQYFR